MFSRAMDIKRSCHMRAHMCELYIRINITFAHIIDIHSFHTQERDKQTDISQCISVIDHCAKYYLHTKIFFEFTKFDLNFFNSIGF